MSRKDDYFGSDAMFFAQLVDPGNTTGFPRSGIVVHAMRECSTDDAGSQTLGFG